MRPPRLAVLASAPDERVARLAALLDAPIVTRRRALPGFRPDVVFVAGPSDTLARSSVACTLAGVAAVVLISEGLCATALPWWGRRFHRVLCASQDETRAWRSVGIALGRLVVIQPGDDDASRRALAALVAEVWAMGSRPRPARRPARARDAGVIGSPP